VLKTTALMKVTGWPVELVDLVGLTRIRRRGKREVGIASELEEKRQFVVDSAPPAVGTAVGEAPVAVNEGPLRATGGCVSREVTVPGERGEVLVQLLAQ
jgi:hypothetical protein